MTESPAVLAPPSIDLAVRPESAAIARRFVRDVVSGHHADPYTVALLTSELVTNAMRAAARVGRSDRPIRLSVTTTDRLTHLAVTDPSPVPPTRRQLGIDALTGRGLAIVEVYAAGPFWVTQGGDGKTVHAVIAAPGVTLLPGELAEVRRT